MANSNPNQQGLRPWQKGQSGNPQGRQKGQFNWSTLVKEVLNNDELLDKIIETIPEKKRPNTQIFEEMGDKRLAFVGAVVMALKMIQGDVKAATWLRKTGWGDKIMFEDEDGRSIKPMMIIDLSDKPKAKPKRKVTSAKKAASDKPKAKRSSRSSKKS